MSRNEEKTPRDRGKVESKSYAKDVLESLDYDTRQFNRIFPQMALATEPLEALFIEYLSYLWSAMRVKGDGSKSYIFRKDERGVWINQRHFTSHTGIRKSTFWRLVRQYEEDGILVTNTAKEEGNRKYYKLRADLLKKYLREKLAEWRPRRATQEAWSDDSEQDDFDDERDDNGERDDEDMADEEADDIIDED